MLRVGFTSVDPEICERVEKPVEARQLVALVAFQVMVTGVPMTTLVAFTETVTWGGASSTPPDVTGGVMVMEGLGVGTDDVGLGTFDVVCVRGSTEGFS